MITNIRGTHGSGKSTIVRRLLDQLPEVMVYRRPDRKRPLAYIAVPEKLVILGHYETPCGGCDSIPKTDEVFELIQQYHTQKYDVLFEGILAQHATPRLLQLAKSAVPVTAIILTTPLITCLEAVRQRREERGVTAPLKTDTRGRTNIEKEYHSVRNAIPRLKAAGIRVLELDRDAAFQHCEELVHRTVL